MTLPSISELAPGYYTLVGMLPAAFATRYYESLEVAKRDCELACEVVLAMMSIKVEA